MADSHRLELDDILNRPGTYFNPQTEVLIVVDDSPEMDAEIFNMEEFEGADWVRISDEVPVDEDARDRLLERFQVHYHAGQVSEDGSGRHRRRARRGRPGGRPGVVPRMRLPRMRRALLLDNRDFTLLWGGETLSEVGSQVSTVAYPLLVLALTGSPTKAGVVGLARWLPLAVFALPAGALADAVDRKRLMIACDAIRMLGAASIALAVLLGRPAYLQLVAVAFLDGGLFVDLLHLRTGGVGAGCRAGSIAGCRSAERGPLVRGGDRRPVAWRRAVRGRASTAVRRRRAVVSGLDDGDRLDQIPVPGLC